MRRFLGLLYGLAAVGTQLYILFVEHRGEDVLLNWLVLIPGSTALGLVWPLVWAERWLHFGGPVGTLLAMR